MDSSPLRPKYWQRWASLDTEFSSWMTHYMEVSRYLLPRNGRFFVTDRNLGDNRFNNIYDNAGTRALKTLAAGLMAGMTSPARPWFRLSTPDPDLMKSAPVKLWLNDVTRLMQMVFSRSNTYRALHSMYLELGAFGTAASIILDDFENVVHHYPLTTGEYRIATDYKGNVTTLYRQFQKTVSEMVREFGKANCSTTVQNMHDSGNLDAWVTIVHLIEPREDRDTTKRDAKNMPWKSVYFELGENQDKYLRESGFKDFRALCPRWDVIGGDIYGTSPGMEALGDIKQLQHQQLRKGQGIDYMVKPPLQVPISFKNHEIDSLPGGTMYVDVNSPTGGIRPAYQVNLNLADLKEDIVDVRQRIDASFYKDLFLMLANMPGVQPRTAQEIAERHEEKLLMLGPVLERQHNELLDPKIEITFARMLEAGIVPPPPPELHGVNLQVEFVSMLAQAQRAVGTGSIDRFVMSLGTVAQFKPDVLDKFDSDNWADAYSDMLGVDPNLIVADNKVALIRRDRAQQQQMAQQAALAQSAADTSSKMAGANTGDKNLLTDATSAFSGYT